MTHKKELKKGTKSPAWILTLSPLEGGSRGFMKQSKADFALEPTAARTSGKVGAKSRSPCTAGRSKL